MHLLETIDSRPVRAVLERPTRYFFFTGKGGVGKTSLASATALALASAGKNVLLVSTDPASNLDEVLGLELGREARPVPKAERFFALNIDPEAAAAAYREKIVGPMRGLLPEAALREMEEQLSGACTMEIAAFDEFTGFLGGGGASESDHIVFDTAPTGHTLRLMALSQAWTNFFNENTGGNSCLGPLAGLEKQREIYAEAVEVLKDAERTRVVLVSRAQKAALKEARRTWGELSELGIQNQCLAINGWFTPTRPDDAVARRWAERQSEAVEAESAFLRSLPIYLAPLLPNNLIGPDALRGFFAEAESAPADSQLNGDAPDFPGLEVLAERLAVCGKGVVLVMGKGGVGKTTVAAALGLALAERGARVRLSTTDPAAHLRDAVGESAGNLAVERIDPGAETKAYVEEVLARQPADLDSESRALLEEDLRSPCTEEIAVFRAFARTVARGGDGFVVLDTAPTGHTLLLLDATQAYHRELGRQSRTTQTSEVSEAVSMLLPRLRDPDFSRVLLVTLPEATPVHEAAALQADLRRAGIEPHAWVINQSMAHIETAEPLLAARGRTEIRYLREVVETHARAPVYGIDWSPVDPAGRDGLRTLLAESVRHFV